MLEHGGRRRAAAQRYGIPEADWLDLSTGINPEGYPLPAIPGEAWQRLPEDDDGLLAAAAACYGNPQLVALAGSQIAIQTLPRLLPAVAGGVPGGAGPTRVANVGVLRPCYAEHAHHWVQAGHAVHPFAASDLPAAAARHDVVVLCNPNNPDGRAWPAAELLAVARRLAERGGLLVVDEAFGDATPELSLAPLAGSEAAPNLVVLRSLGKFYGLAGARVGFAVAAPPVLAALREAAGPWPVSGPARWVARAALADRAWQAATREHLRAAGRRLAALLDPFATSGQLPVATALFAWLPTPRADALHEALARRGILVRHFPEFAGLRFGLPGDEPEWQRLAAALESLR